ncbi:MAG TPA: HEAT repeat domain-containing protein [Phycisphaerales bacterium]|nr:HEAT repeat domain-containing protein [Phycisphaerales bacterium]HMP38126.1 HEAT repeat domain-containing protein [Phycisphaerales bacterium]
MSMPSPSRIAVRNRSRRTATPSVSAPTGGLRRARFGGPIRSLGALVAALLVPESGALLGDPALGQGRSAHAAPQVDRPGSVVVAPPSRGGGPAAGATPRRLLEDFLHYVRIARPDLAAANATALFDRGISDAELADLVDENDLAARVESTIRLGRGMEGVGDLVAEFETRLENGRRDLGRDPRRIKEAVQMLTGTRRQQMLAQARLAQAGEYAVPELLRQVVESRDPALELAAAEMLVEIRRQAVSPLSEALRNLDPVNQRRVADILGRIAWPHSLPYLLALSADSAAPDDVREAAARAFAAAGGTSTDLGGQWTALAKRHFDEEQSLIAFPAEPTNNLWGWDDFVGLVATPVPTEIFSEIMAMRAAREALAVAPADEDALALFVASNLRRENNLPEGAVDPIFTESAVSPQFYATAAGISSASRVLELALAARDTQLVRDAIEALRETVGPGNLGGRSGSRAAGRVEALLAECLRYPDRRVQYEAALALGRALPRQSFAGDFSVVPTLASAVRTGDANFAVVVAAENEDRQALSGRLQAMGFTIVAAADRFRNAQGDVAAAPGIDLVVIRGPRDFARGEANSVRTDQRTLAAPVLVISDALDKVALDRDFEQDRGVLISQAGLGDEPFGNAIEAVMRRTSGGRITESEAMIYALEALETLKGIGLSSSPVFRLEDAQAAFFDALGSRTGGVRLMIADVLAMMDTVEAQRMLFDTALAAEEAEQVELLDRVAASARRFGNRLEPRQIEALVRLVGSSSGPLADAAGRLHGALDLPAATAVRVIVK